MSLLTMLFFGFLGIIVMFQLVPSIIMFYAMVRSLFVAIEKEEIV